MLGNEWSVIDNFMYPKAQPRRLGEPFGVNIDPATRASTLRGVSRVEPISALFIQPGTSVRLPLFAAAIACRTTAFALM
jgi:hypothetical protein